MAFVKVSVKDQGTIAIRLRRKLRIRKHDLLAVEAEGQFLKLRKISEIQPLGSDDPIWALVGRGSTGKHDVAARHDDYLAQGERKRWGRS